MNEVSNKLVEQEQAAKDAAQIFNTDKIKTSLTDIIDQESVNNAE